MIKLVIPDVQPDLFDLTPYNKRVEEICLLLIAREPKLRVLEGELLVKVATRPEDYVGWEFVIPGNLVDKHFPTRRSTVLVTSVLNMYRKFNWSFTIIGPSLKSLDKRVRDLVDKVKIWGAE